MQDRSGFKRRADLTPDRLRVMPSWLCTATGWPRIPVLPRAIIDWPTLQFSRGDQMAEGDLTRLNIAHRDGPWFSNRSGHAAAVKCNAPVSVA